MVVGEVLGKRNENEKGNLIRIQRKVVSVNREGNREWKGKKRKV